MGAHSTQAQTIVHKALVFPPCECGAAYTAHKAGRCQHYRPSRAIEDWGTRAVKYGAGMPLLRRLVCQALWSVEYRLQGWREALARRS